MRIRVPRAAALLFALLLLAAGTLPQPATVYLAGDSTMAQKLVGRRPETGWGEQLQQYFDLDDVRIENHARNGRSTRTFIAEGRWDRIVAALRPGDYVLIQFGHNDGSIDKHDRYTPPADYRANLLRFVSDVRARGAAPILLTPVRRRRFDAGGRLVDTHGEYPDIVRAVAREAGVPLLDLHRRTGELLERLGEQASRALFLHLAAAEHPNYPDGLRDDTHFSPLGAAVAAALAVEELARSGTPLAAQLQPAPPDLPALLLRRSATPSTPLP